MAITVRLTFDVRDESLEDTNENALALRDAAMLTYGKPAMVELVGASRLTTGPMQGSATVEAVEGVSWHRVEEAV